MWAQGSDGLLGVWEAYYAFVVFTVAVTVAVVLGRRRLIGVGDRLNRLTLILAGALVLLDAAMCFAPPLGAAGGLLLIDAALRALVFVGLTMAWSSVLVRRDNRTLLVDLFASLALSSVLMFASVAPGVLGLVAPLSTPLISVVFLKGVPKKPEMEPVSSSWRSLPWGLIGVLALSNFIVALLYGVTPINDTFSPDGTWVAIRVACPVVSALIVVLVWRSSRPTVSLTMIWLVLTIVLIMAMFLAVIFSPAWIELSKGLILASQTCLNVFLWGVLVAACRRSRIAPAPVLAVLYASLLAVSGCVANLIGPLAARIIPSDGESSLVAITAFLTLVLVLVSLLFLGKTAFRADEGGEGAPATQPDAISDRLAAKFDLSLREAEVTALLARGYSVQRVADALFISTHTVQSHMKSIYRKLGVHKKQELIELVERETACG